MKMEMIFPTLYTLLFLIIWYATVFHYYHIRFIVAVVTNLPNLIKLLTLQFALQILAWFNMRKLEDGCFHPSINLFYRKLSDYFDLIDEITLDVFHYVFGERGKEMAIRLKKPGSIERYIPLSERELPKHEQSVIKMRRLGARDRARFQDGQVTLSEKGRIKGFRSATTSLKITLAMLEGWENMIGADGQPMEFDPRDKENMFDHLPEELQAELIKEFGSPGQEELEEEDEVTEELPEAAE